MSALLGGVEIAPVERPEEAADADVIVTITSSREPVLQGAWLEPGAHINAAGGNSILRRELDDEAIKRSSFIAVDSIDQAKIDAGRVAARGARESRAWGWLDGLRTGWNGQ